jgi:hypothetical protein
MNAGVLIFALLFGAAGWEEANRTKKRYGRTPFDWPALVWGFVCFLSFVIGAILLAIGERAIRKAAAATPVYGGSYTQPVNGAPGYAAPGYAAPGYGEAAYAPPAYAPPAYAPPPQQAPAYVAPVQPPVPQPRPLGGDVLPK